MKKNPKLLTVLLASMLLASCGQPGPSASSQSGGNQSTNVPAKIVEDIRIKTLPKTEYVLGEEFSIEGGIIELIYEGGGTGEVPFSDPKVTINHPALDSIGTKTVIVDYDGFTDQYQITVKNQTVLVYLDLNYEGAVNPNPIEVEVGEYAFKPADPVRVDHRFVAWCTDKEGTSPFDFEDTPINASITLYASWVQELSVSFDLDDGSQPTKVIYSLGDNVSVFSAPSVLRQGYQFLGWYSGEERFDFQDTISSSFTLKAKWQAIPQGSAAHRFTADFNAGENKGPIEYYVADGATTFQMGDPLIEGKEFLGWFAAKGGNDKYDFSAPISQDTTIYAHYRVDFYTVTFKYIANGEETTFRTRTVKPGEKASAVAQSPRVENYRFDGKWYTDKGCTTLFDFNQPIDSDVVLYTKALKRNVFEAEYTNIDENKQGVGSSDSFTGLKLIFEDNGTAGASNGYWVSGLYNNGSFIEFVIQSTKAVDDALLEMNFSSEWADIYLAPQNVNVGGRDYYGFEIANYKGNVNETGAIILDAAGYASYEASTKSVVDYQPIALEGAITFSQSAYDKRPFTTHFLTDHFHLFEGYNVVRLTVCNSVSPFDGTMNANAPMIDNMVIYTDSELSWTPKEENVSNWEAINFAPNKHGL